MAEAPHESWGDAVAVGAPVFTQDGHRLGAVQELRGLYFRVAAPRHPDYWLQRSVVRPGADARVTTAFERHDRHAYQVTNVAGGLADSGVARSDAALLGEAGTGTDTVIDRSGAP
jgi:hypothetical protein